MCRLLTVPSKGSKPSSKTVACTVYSLAASSAVVLWRQRWHCGGVAARVTPSPCLTARRPLTSGTIYSGPRPATVRPSALNSSNCWPPPLAAGVTLPTIGRPGLALTQSAQNAGHRTGGAERRERRGRGTPRSASVGTAEIEPAAAAANSMREWPGKAASVLALLCSGPIFWDQHPFTSRWYWPTPYVMSETDSVLKVRRMKKNCRFNYRHRKKCRTSDMLCHFSDAYRYSSSAGFSTNNFQHLFLAWQETLLRSCGQVKLKLSIEIEHIYLWT